MEKTGVIKRLKNLCENYIKHRVNTNIAIFIGCVVIAGAIFAIALILPIGIGQNILILIAGAFLSLGTNALYFTLNKEIFMQDVFTNKDILERIDDQSTKIVELYTLKERIETLSNNISNLQTIESTSNEKETKIEELDSIIKNLSDNLSNSVKTINHIESCSQEKPRILKENDFYKYLKKAREDVAKRFAHGAVSTIYLTNFSRLLGRVEETTDDEYFNEEINYCIQNSNITIKRIVSVRSEEKLNQLKNMISKIPPTIQNLHIAYLNTKWLHSKNFHLRESFYLPKLIGSQIHGDEVIIMNPMTARISADPRVGSTPMERANIKKHIFIKNQEIADIFASYHDILWQEIEDVNDSEQLGCILYEGNQEDEPEIADENIWNIIKSQM